MPYRLRSLIVSFFVTTYFFYNTSIAQVVTMDTANTWVWRLVNVGKAYRSFLPKKKIKIAIIDGSFDTEHGAFKKYLAGNENEIPDNDIDDDKNGFTDDVTGWDFADGDNNIMPLPSAYSDALHAMRVADVFLQMAEQLVPDAEKYISIMPLKTKSDKSNNNYITAGYKALEYAVARHADIILCCWGGTMISSEQKKILQKAAESGVIIIATAGNFYFNEPQYPGAFDKAICVTAVTKNETKQAVANFGSFTDIAAPGDSILTLGSKSMDRKSLFSGTSAAAPIVAGVIAALKVAGYDGTLKDMDRLLKNSAIAIDSKNPLYAGNMGAGLLNVEGVKSLINEDRVMMYQQPCAYINIQKLNTHIPVKVMAQGSFKDYKITMQPPAGAASASLMIRYFKHGMAKQMIWKGTMFNRPVYVDADSFYLYGTIDKKSKALRYIYYEAETVDSSYYYCSGTVIVKDTAGTIEDGSGMQNYTGKNDCKWLIEVPKGKRISIDFTEFDTEAKKDQIYIFNGEITNAPILAIFSGPNIPPHILTGSNIALVWFISTETVQGKGWKLHFKAVD